MISQTLYFDNTPPFRSEYVLPGIVYGLVLFLPLSLAARSLDPGGRETKERTKEQRKITRVNGAATRGMCQSEMRRYMLASLLSLPGKYLQL